ncbi:NAD-dependent epimerase/dehydratase family protein [Phenylobacterium deserti]|uniref:Epimerase n=1 Tax=Phenylobacterium deserti TaxID=1914756 RepID=A0A328AHF5_9CAUL|nr:NAD-dependent epimerase/dehydratase family protein [Phenylobacterium deserti]RAK52784.1 epimerase [Phenylobacterium deserti]
MARLAAVTGATGFLGRHLVRALFEAGWQVRILARKDPIDPSWRGFEPEVVPGDLADSRGLAALCAGAEVVVHAAGLVKARSKAAFEAVNVAGTRRVAEAALQAGAERLLLVSSLAAREPQLSDYASSKRQAEDVAREILSERVTVVRPPAIYGPGDVELLPLFQAALTSPVLPVFDSRARIAAIHVEDAARQIAAMAGAPPAQELVTLSDARPDGYGWRELMEAALAASGRKAPLVRTPELLVTFLGVFGALGQAMGHSPMLTPGKAREMRHLDWSVHEGERGRDLPPPVYSLTDGFRDTLRWNLEAGVLSR